MRKFIQNVKRRTSGAFTSVDIRREWAESRQIERSNSSPLPTDDSPRAVLSSYQEVPMILDWQLPSDDDAGHGMDASRVSIADTTPVRTGSSGSDNHSPQFPLPLELLYLIIDHYLSQDLKELLNLGRAVPALRHHCWTHAFRSVKIVIRQREIERKKETSNIDLFLQLLGRIPKIYEYVQELDIQDRGRMVWGQQVLASTSQEDLTTLSLLLVQTKRMSKLKGFRITTPLIWTNLPLYVKESFFAMFTSSTLSEIALSGILLPVNFLALIRNLKAVDFQTGGVGPSLFHPSLVNQHPKQVDTLKIRDRNPFSNPMSVLGFSDHSHKPFSLGHLRHLEICLPGKRLSSVQEGLRQCQSLEVFKVFVGTAGGLPEALKLDALPSLRHLTLAADITNILDASYRFDWAIKLLESLPATSPLNEVTLLMRTSSLEQGKQCEWSLLDSLFHLPESHPSFENVKPEVILRWPSLQSFKIVWCTARSQDIQEDANADFMRHLPIFIPHLHVRGVIKMQTTYSDTHYNFWTYT